MTTPHSLALLPREILNEILSELDQINDLLSLAFTSRANADLVIPEHTEYRRIRTRTPMPAMWAHLAQRADLARNIREVQLCARQDYTAPDRFPVTLVDSSNHHDDELKRVEHICAALGHMTMLTTFVWHYEPDIKAGRRRLNHQHEEMVLSSLAQTTSLRHLMLRGECGVHIRGGKGTQRQPYPLWSIGGLESLSLLGTAWTNKSNSGDLIRFIQRSPDIEFLEVPMELHGLDACHLPRLKRLGLPMTSGAATWLNSASAGTVADPVVAFLHRNPSIEELNWSTTLAIKLSPDSLPNLRSLRGNVDVIRGLEASDAFLPRPIENLDIWDADSDCISTLESLDVSTLRKLRIGRVSSLESLYTIAERFKGITWLRLPATEFDLAQLLDILSCFTNLEVFRGLTLWDAAGGETHKEQMHEAILDLVERCPRLRQLDHCSFNDKRKAAKLIKIYRKLNTAGELEQVWYEVERPPPGNVFDVMTKVFD
ncbi:hypothetical protein DXG01_011354 [Tephrocybe rancida]|nr:hypothetical protein DXG01_011354 [Tephrocybe rancida]